MQRQRSKGAHAACPHVARGGVALPIYDSYIVPRVSKNCAKTRQPGWAYRTRTAESVRELSIWRTVIIPFGLGLGG